MAITTTTQLDSSLQTILQAEYIIAMEKGWIYGQDPISWTPANAIVSASNRGSAISIPFYTELVPSTAALSQTADVTPVTFGDQVVTVTPDMYGNAVQLSQKLRLTATPDVARATAELVARNAAETMDYVARDAAIGGTMVKYGGGAPARGTSMTETGAQLTLADWFTAKNFLAAARCPDIGGTYVAITRPAVVMDQIEDGTIILVAEYQQGSMLLNGEIGQHIAGVRIIESNNAKIYHGAGTTNAMSSGYLSSAFSAGSTYVTINSALTTSVVGDYVAIGTPETTGAENAVVETVKMTCATNATTITLVGGGANGGLIYDHSSGASVSGNFQVYGTVFCGGQSLLKCYTNDDGLGPNGLIIPPEETGLLKQFTSWGWKGFVGYAIVAQNRVWRVEHTSARYTLGK